VPPTFRQIDLGSSGLPAPSSISALRGPAPVHIAIPAIGVDSVLGQVDLLSDGTLAAPSHADQPGWYRRGPTPGQTGPAVIVGHLDSATGPAVFYRLSSLRAGDLVEVGREDRSLVRFRVQRLATYSTDGFSTAEVYGATSAPELRLITCGGSYSLSRRQYVANVVAFASFAG
jgi:sortase (surface protein transpeptidase)